MITIDVKNKLSLSQIKDQIIIYYLTANSGNRAKTARDLKVGLRTIQRRIKILKEKGVLISD
jgi:hypothetical protein